MIKLILFSTICLGIACQGTENYKVSAPPKELVQRLNLDPFYKKHCDTKGFPIISSDKVNDYAFKEAAYLIDTLLKDREDIRKMLIEKKVRYIIYAIDEYTTDIPEHKHLANSKKGKDWWDRRARGLGALPHCPATTCGEENLLCYKGDPYKQENILIHEFAHTIHQCALDFIDPTFDKRLEATYKDAMKKGLWKTKYASTNRMEYWAEGVQSWFNDNRENDHDHNHVNTREELVEYDAGLAKLCEEVFGSRMWTYTKPITRLKDPHLKGFDSSKSPIFKWPKRLANIKFN